MRPPARPRVPARPVEPRPRRAVRAPAGPPSGAPPSALPPSAAGRPAAVPPSAVPPPAAGPAGTAVTRTPRGWAPVRPEVVSPGSAARFAERVAMRRRLQRDKVLLTLGVGAVVAGLGWLLLVSPVLALRLDQVQVAGQGSVVDAAAVAAVVAPYDGVPLPRLDTVALRRAVLDVPGVRAAEVTRLWPHGLSVEVVSREPVAAVPRDGGFSLLDVEGVQVGRLDEVPAGLPVIDVPRDDQGARALTAVLSVLEQLPPVLAAQVVSIEAQNQDTVRLGLSDGAVVEWGSADRSALKVRVLATLRAAPTAASVEVFDVSAPTLPITRS